MSFRSYSASLNYRNSPLSHRSYILPPGPICTFATFTYQWQKTFFFFNKAFISSVIVTVLWRLFTDKEQVGNHFRDCFIGFVRRCRVKCKNNSNSDCSIADTRTNKFRIQTFFLMLTDIELVGNRFRDLAYCIICSKVSCEMHFLQ